MAGRGAPAQGATGIASRSRSPRGPATRAAPPTNGASAARAHPPAQLQGPGGVGKLQDLIQVSRAAATAAMGSKAPVPGCGARAEELPFSDGWVEDPLAHRSRGRVRPGCQPVEAVRGGA
mmetsp:Transcript_97693/g.209641  ORF Transcript_97693/g.209641 Transcript_97693/m.209641 type:complete len:120 (-) Transcript_97693:73-432(-)